MKPKIPKSERRTIEQLQQHYEIEKAFAMRLRNSSKEERKHLYNTLYNDLNRLAHSNNLELNEPNSKNQVTKIDDRMSLLKRFLSQETVFLEIGPGDCQLSIQITDYVHKVIALDVSIGYIGSELLPENFELRVFDGCKIPVPDNSISLAYSDQVMEHLHPDDAFDQLKDVHRVLISGGKYICITPNALTGPHDISKYFSRTPTGFHMKEYTFKELRDLFHKAGFSIINSYVGGRKVYVRFSSCMVITYEKLYSFLPSYFRKALASTLLSKLMFSNIIIGTKE